MKYLNLVFIVCVLLACNNEPVKETSKDTALVSESPGNSAAAEEPATIPADQLIVPGKSIGRTVLHENADSLETNLGTPDFSDAAMGKAWLTWYGKKRDEHNNKTVLNIYTTYEDTSMRKRTVQQIRTTSSYFTTADNVHVYSSFENIRSNYSLYRAASYTDEGRSITLYDDVAKGIAFEIADTGAQKICTGIIIHDMGKKATDIYIMLHPDMKLLDDTANK